MKENERLKGLVDNQKKEDSQKQQQSQQQQQRNVSYYQNPRPPSNPASSAHQAVSNLAKDDYRLLAAIQASHQSFCITNPALPDNPIVFASKKFIDLTGYKRDQIIGRNCRFMQGPGTDNRQLEILRRGIAAGVDTTVCILNYKANGTAFYNQLFLAPLRDVDNRIVNYLGVQVEVNKYIYISLHNYIYIRFI